MIRFQPIVASDVQHCRFMEELLIESFPPEEHHKLEHLHEYTNRISSSHNDIISDDDLPIDSITYRNFDEFYHMEHSVTNSALRSGDCGKHTLEHLCESLKHLIVLEVGRPIEEMAKHCINFYQWHGLTLQEKDYCQPPYKEGDNSLSTYLIVRNNLDTGKDHEGVRHKLYAVIYGVEE